MTLDTNMREGVHTSNGKYIPFRNDGHNSNIKIKKIKNIGNILYKNAKDTISDIKKIINNEYKEKNKSNMNGRINNIHEYNFEQEPIPGEKFSQPITERPIFNDYNNNNINPYRDFVNNRKGPQEIPNGMYHRSKINKNKKIKYATIIGGVILSGIVLLKLKKKTK